MNLKDMKSPLIIRLTERQVKDRFGYKYYCKICKRPITSLDFIYARNMSHVACVDDKTKNTEGI